jgi:hypothetical protein
VQFAPHLDCVCRRLQHIGHADISQLGPALRGDEYVGTLDVGVYDALLVQIVESCSQEIELAVRESLITVRVGRHPELDVLHCALAAIQ